MPRVSITIPDKNPQPYRFNLDHKKVTIGRSKDSDIVIDEPSVSGLHATMERVEGGYVLRDRGSTNGISLDDDLMDIIDLRNGDDVKVGDVVFDYHLTEDEQTVLDEEEFHPHEKVKSENKEASDEDSLDDKEEEEDEDELPSAKKAKKPVKKKKVTAQAPRPAAVPVPQPMVVSQSGGGFFSGLIALILGVLAFFGGVMRSYEKTEEANGRENVSLLQDMKEGKPKASAIPPASPAEDE